MKAKNSSGHISGGLTPELLVSSVTDVANSTK